MILMITNLLIALIIYKIDFINRIEIKLPSFINIFISNCNVTGAIFKLSLLPIECSNMLNLLFSIFQHVINLNHLLWLHSMLNRWFWSNWFIVWCIVISRIKGNTWIDVLIIFWILSTFSRRNDSTQISYRTCLLLSILITNNIIRLSGRLINNILLPELLIQPWIRLLLLLLLPLLQKNILVLDKFLLLLTLHHKC